MAVLAALLLLSALAGLSPLAPRAASPHDGLRADAPPMLVVDGAGGTLLPAAVSRAPVRDGTCFLEAHR